MVLFTMTVPMVEALEKVQSLKKVQEGKTKEGMGAREPETQEDQQGEQSNTGGAAGDSVYDEVNEVNEDNGVRDQASSSEPSLSNPILGNPISHGQVIDLWKELKAHNLSPQSLDTLLQGARIYVPPPRLKPEPTSEYKALMSRLRAEEEARSYHRLTHPIPAQETFASRFPSTSAANAFSSSYSHQDAALKSSEDDETTYADVDRQMALIFNVLLSIVACAAAIWIAARWWSTPARLAVSFGGAILVGTAEVVVYAGYIRRVGEAKGKEKGIKEFKEVVNTWVVGGGEGMGDEDDTSIKIEGKEEQSKARRRK